MSITVNIIELDDGKIYRKPLYLMVKTMVSCRFPLNQSIDTRNMVFYFWQSRDSMFESTCLEEWFYGRGKPDWVSRLSRQQELVCTWWINGISRVNPLITGVITHLLSGMNHQVWLVGESGKDKQLFFVRLGRQPSGVGWNPVFRASWFVHDGGRKVLKEKYIWYIYIYTHAYIYI